MEQAIVMDARVAETQRVVEIMKKPSDYDLLLEAVVIELEPFSRLTPGYNELQEQRNTEKLKEILAIIRRCMSKPL